MKQLCTDEYWGGESESFDKAQDNSGIDYFIEKRKRAEKAVCLLP